MKCRKRLLNYCSGAENKDLERLIATEVGIIQLRRAEAMNDEKYELKCVGSGEVGRLPG